MTPALSKASTRQIRLMTPLEAMKSDSERGKKDFGQKPKPDPMNAFAPPEQEGTWTKRADMPTPRNGPSTSVVNGKIYAIGGIDNVFRFLSTVEEYDPGFKEPQSVTPAGKLSTLWGRLKAAR
jgi:hypothetical protein